MARVFLIHGWGGHPGEHWFPWISRELAKKGHKVIEPAMPRTDTPEMHEWVGKLMQVVGRPRKDDVLIGHSIGCQTILRYLALLPKNERVDKVVLVAPWTRLKNLSKEEKMIAHAWIHSRINWRDAKARANSFTAIFSTNDPYVYVSEGKLFAKKLRANIIIEKNKGHFTKENKITKIPALKKELLG